MIFSVIIPCYNNEKTIQRALSSVASQTLKDFEIIVVDDGSTDATQKEIEAFFDHTALMYRYIHQDNAGAASARNVGAKYASGDFLAFLDADDEWRSDKLEVQYGVIRHYNAKFISASYTFEPFTNDKKPLVVKYNFRDFLFSNRTSTPCTIVQRALFNDLGGFLDGQRYSEDYYLWLNIAQKEPLYFIEKPSLTRLYKRAYGQSGLSSKLWEMEKGELANYRYCYEKKFITRGGYLFFLGLSILKYVRRVIKNSLQGNCA